VIDTHCHLSSSRFKKDRAEVLSRARMAGVTHFLEVGYDLPTSERSLHLARREPDIWATVGIHPHEVAKAPEDGIEQLRRLAEDTKVVALGEIGLDFYRNLSPPDAQRDWFARQLGLARELELPVVIHTRDAMDEMLDILAKAALPRRGVLHCYSGNADQVRRACDIGFSVAFGGTVTYGLRELEEAARATPREMLVVETDAPYLVPEPKDTKRNEPALLARVRARLSELREESEEDIDGFTTQNALRLFAIAARG
jgi:TatD DNase family protein